MWERRSEREWVAAAVLLLIWLASVLPGFLAVHNVHWHYDLDGFRDIALAQRMRDGRWSSDPFYEGQVNWYSPTLAAIVAIVSAASDASVPSTLVRVGSWLNAVAPLAFFFCVRSLVGAWPALGATCAFLFLPGRPPAWASATYTPWPFPAVAAQSLFYIGVKLWTDELAHPRLGRAILLGIILGCAFLTHTAASVLLGAVMLLSSVIMSTERPKTSAALEHLRSCGISCVIALVLAAPFVFPFLSSYGMQTKNRAPATWVYEALGPMAMLRSQLSGSELTTLIVAVVGGVALVRFAEREVVLVLAAWGAAAIGLLIYCLGTERLESLPPLVPAYHFFFYLRALKWALFGIGVFTVAMAAAARAPRWLGGRVGPIGSSAILIALLSAALYPRYLGREAFVSARQRALAVEADVSERAVYDWIRRETNLEAVFLASDMEGLRIVGPAGRSVVSVAAHFSNPFVAHGQRSRLRDQMYEAIYRGDGGTFRTLARPFGVTHVLVPNDRAAGASNLSASFLDKVFSNDLLTVFAVPVRALPGLPRRASTP